MRMISDDLRASEAEVSDRTLPDPTRLELELELFAAWIVAPVPRSWPGKEGEKDE